MEGGGRAWLENGSTCSDAKRVAGGMKECELLESTREIDAVVLNWIETSVARDCKQLREPSIRLV